MSINAKRAEFLVQQLNVLLVDDNAFTRKLVRGLLNNIGNYRSRRRHRRA
jgi:CheY-like chemotaxis protein